MCMCVCMYVRLYVLYSFIESTDSIEQISSSSASEKDKIDEGLLKKN